jgi:hypothetical protein
MGEGRLMACAKNGAASIGLLALAAAPANIGLAGPPGDVACRIVASDAAGLLQLEAIAQSRRALAGAYVFTVSKHSASGVSDSTQSGQVALEAGRPSILTRIALDGSAKGHYSAKLSLTWDQGSVSCLSP